MLNIKDRKPAFAGSRSFFQVKTFFIIVSILLIIILYSMQLIVAIIPEEENSDITFATYKGDTWYISLTHSVEKTEWNEYFRVNAANDMTMTHTRFESLGWGYPYSAADGVLRQEKSGKFILEMNRPYKIINLRISQQAMQHIIHGNDNYDLVTFYGQGAALKIKAVYRYQYWIEKFFD